MKEELPGYFLNADDLRITKMVYKSYDDLLKLLSANTFYAHKIKNFTRLIRERIQLFNIAGFLDHAAKICIITPLRCFDFSLF
jgi:hypothetical protein